MRAILHIVLAVPLHDWSDGEEASLLGLLSAAHVACELELAVERSVHKFSRVVVSSIIYGEKQWSA